MEGEGKMNRKRNKSPATIVLFLSVIVVSLALVTPATASTSGTYVQTYANILNNIEYNLTPVDVQPTSDGGYIALTLTQAPQSANGVGVDWLVKLSSSGTPQWQQELGCFGTPPGDYTDGLSVQQTADGGYIVAGGTLGCGSHSACPSASGIQCALIEKLGSAGKLDWSHVYLAGPDGSSINQIKQTSDGGYIAAGTATDPNQNTSALILKLDGKGNVQWQRDLGPSGSTQAYFNSVQQTSDGGYVAAGDYYTPVAGSPPTRVLAAKFDPSGNLTWQHGFTSLDGTGSQTSVEDAQSIIQTSDGGYAVAGLWSNSTFPGQGARGALLLKLGTDGNIQWQNAYSGGVYCYFNGYSETCTDIGAVIYSMHQTADGGYLLAGDGNLELTDSVPQVPWLAKVDASGNLTWQHFYYQTHTTGRPLSQYFAASALAPDGGYLAAGVTENYPAQKNELYLVKTDSTGLVGTCGSVHPATPLSAISPGLTTVAPSLPVQTPTTSAVNSPSRTLATSITTTANC
jgi:hypothetical protein